jgi:hypothetical protein
MVSPGAKMALAGVGAGAVAFGLGYLLLRPSKSKTSHCGDPGYYPCEGGACCPDADTCANSDGTCPAGSRPDSANPGCCINACPPSCQHDLDCLECGAAFVCENHQCTKQQPAFLSGNPPISLAIPQEFDYTETACIAFFICTSCLKCCGPMCSSKPGGSANFVATVTDAASRGVPGVKLQASVDGAGFTIVPVNPSNGITDANGNVQYMVLGTDLPIGWDDPNNAAYGCSACSGGVDEGVNFIQMGNLVVEAPDFPALGALHILVESELYHAGHIVEIGGCSCV